MFEKIIRIWKVISNNGVRAEHTYEDIKRIKVINQASLIGLINTVLYIIVLAFISFPKLIKGNIEFSVIFDISLLTSLGLITFTNLILLKKYDYKIGAIFQLVSIPTLLLTCNIVFDHSGTQYYYFSFLILLFYLIKDRKLLILISHYYALLFILANLFDIVFRTTLIASENTIIFYYVNVVVSFITSISFLTLFIQEYERKQQEIITTNIELEKNIAITTQQKEEIQMMMKEISHRTKNNLQLVSSIINIQSKNITDPNAKNTIDDIRNRIVSMALLHQKLYLNNNLNTFLLEGFIDDLLNYLLGIYDNKANPVKITKHIDEIEIKIDNAIHLGLLLNELLTNSFKHGIVKSKDKFINLKVTQNDKHKLLISISDSGQNINKLADQNFSKTFGASLIHSLVEQLKGAISFNIDDKNEIIITVNLDS